MQDPEVVGSTWGPTTGTVKHIKTARFQKGNRTKIVAAHREAEMRRVEAERK